jgi:hypothetical protein
MTAKTTAQRQAALKARRIAAGYTLWKRWMHRQDADAMTLYADRLAKNRARAELKGRGER